MGDNLHEITEEYFDLNKVVTQRMQLYKESFELAGRKDLMEKLEEVEALS